MAIQRNGSTFLWRRSPFVPQFPLLTTF
jgi:hypothetical protein